MVARELVSPSDLFDRLTRDFGLLRQFRLQGDDVTASSEGGVLSIVVPEAEAAKPRRIEVQ